MTQTLDKTDLKMEQMPVGKLLLEMAWPIMLVMLIQSLYNIVDSIFVSRICEDALTAVSIGFPVQRLMTAIGTGVSIGISAILARSLGEHDVEKAKRVAGNSILLILISYVVFLCIGLFWLEPYFRGQTDDEAIIRYGIEYLSVVLCYSFGSFVQITYDRILQATGKNVYTIFTQGAGALINCVLDPILIFGLGPFPEMGVKGAAIATVVSQIAAGISSVVINFFVNKRLRISFSHLIPDFKIIGKIYSIGIPTAIMQSLSSVTTFFINNILIAFTKTATAVLGVYNKLFTFIFLPINGLGAASIPIISYNLGAKKIDRVKAAFKMCVIQSVVISLAGTLIFMLFPKFMLVKFFDAGESMVKIGIPAFRIMCTSYFVAGFSIALSSAFQALGKSKYSMITQILRQLVVLIPIAKLLSATGSLNLVWCAYPISDVVSFFLCIGFVFRILKLLDKGRL